MGNDPFGRAIRDYHLGQQDEPLIHRDGDERGEHPIEGNYFGEFCPGHDWTSGIEQHLDGPLLDIGAGVGKHTLYFQEQFETVAIEVSEYLVETMSDRGVEDARHVDMFALREAFGRDRFQSVLANGTQLGLVGSMQGLRRFLGDIAYVTGPDGTAVLDCYDPTLERTKNAMGYRDDPTPGLAYRVLHFEYEDDVGETLLFRLFSPDRIREATVGTGWNVEEIWRVPADNPCQLEIALTKQ
jgi:SAM-dependent methyltransferase